jgi:hypothetical protein
VKFSVLVFQDFNLLLEELDADVAELQGGGLLCDVIRVHLRIYQLKISTN